MKQLSAFPTPADIWMMAGNVLLACLYLCAASASWIEPELADVPGASGGDGLVWFMTAVPIFLLSIAGNLSAWVYFYVSRIKHTALVVPLVVATVWVIAAIIYYKHHGV